MFNLLQIGKKALMASEMQLQVTGNNIANSNTEGYSRQRVEQIQSDPIYSQIGYIGNGVETAAVERMRDTALDGNYREENSLFGFWDSASTALSELETDLNEPSDYGLTARLSNFYDCWEELSNDPTSTAYRQDMLDTAEELVSSFKDASSCIDDKRSEINAELSSYADEVNSISTQLATLNVQISQAEQNGVSANTLRDQFDKLLDQLSEYGDVTVQERSGDGSTVVYLGTDQIVKHDQYRTLTTKDETVDGENVTNLVWSDTQSEISGLEKGRIAGITHVRDDLLTGYQKQLNAVAVALTESVNTLHRTGYGDGTGTNGLNFFDPDTTSAADIAISSDIDGHPEAIAASQDGSSGDNRIALKMAELRDSEVLNGVSITNSLGSLFSQLGTDSSTASNYADTYTDTTTQADNLREAVKGVSLNEEAANLMQYQKSFQAAAKVIAAADDLLNTVIGLVN
jgi:flagellar hook-associated protein 1 FlgK